MYVRDEKSVKFSDTPASLSGVGTRRERERHEPRRYRRAVPVKRARAGVCPGMLMTAALALWVTASQLAAAEIHLHRPVVDSTEMQALRRQAQAGDAQAQLRLGLMYLTGRGLGRDVARAREWLGRSAGAGTALAQMALGRMYATGIGVPTDLAEAVSWYRRAGDQGHAPAQFSLGLAYDQGRGVARDVAVARQWYERAAMQGYAKAQTSLGLALVSGRGGSPDLPTGVEWLRRAAKSGDGLGQVALGRLYVTGQGVAQSDIAAFAWFSVAAAAGSAEAADLLSQLEARMSAPDLEEARRVLDQLAGEQTQSLSPGE